VCCAMRGVVCRGGMDQSGVDVTRMFTRFTSVSSTVSDPSIWRPQSVSQCMYLPRLETGAGGHATFEYPSHLFAAHCFPVDWCDVCTFARLCLQ
jgi:hypothetical protein